MKKVICFGEILWDNFKTGKKPGGAPMNVALHLLRNKIQGTVISSIGNDANGKELLNYLQTQGLSINTIQTSPHLPTGMVEVHLDDHQHATYTIVQPVAWDAIAHLPALNETVAAADALIFGSLASRSQTSRETLFQLLPLAKLRVLDLNLRAPHFQNTLLKELIRQCDILKINEDELSYIANLYQIPETSQEHTLQRIAETTGLTTICVTLGDKGAKVYHKQQLYAHAGFKIKVADTVGAGDAFLATLLAGLLKEAPMVDNLTRACAAGALVASRHGANPGYSPEDIDSLISS